MTEFYSNYTYQVMIYLGRKPNTDKSTIARELKIHPDAIDDILKRMCEENKISICQDKHHKQRKLFVYSEQFIRQINKAANKEPTMAELVIEALNNPVGTSDEQLVRSFKERKYKELIQDR